MLKFRIFKQKLSILFIVGIFGLFLTGCSGSSTGYVSSTEDAPKILSILPLAQTAPLNSEIIFTASGGVEPYVFEVHYGNGSIKNSGTNGIYQTPALEGTTVVRVVDSARNVGYATVETSESPFIQPSNKTLAVNNKFAFSVINGKAPYVFSIVNPVTDDSSIVDKTGEFTSGTVVGATVLVRVVDANGRKSDSSVVINKALSFGRKSDYVQTNSNYNLSTLLATGGVPPYTFKKATGLGTLNKVNLTDLVFSAPDTPGESIIQVSDTLGNSDLAILRITAPLVISPTVASLAKNGTLTFSALGGKPNYNFSILDNGPGSLTSWLMTAQFTAPSTSGTGVKIRITDGYNNQSDASVLITENFSFSISNLLLAVNDQFDLSTIITGSSGQLNYSAPANSGTIIGSVYRAPSIPGVYYLTINDSALPTPNTGTATIYVNSELTLLPASGTVIPLGSNQGFSASGGVQPYNYSSRVASNTESTALTNGIFFAGSVGFYEIKVVDFMGHIKTSTIEVRKTLSIAPNTANIIAGGIQQFTATDAIGTVHFSLTPDTPISIGSINSVTGDFVAGSTTAAGYLVQAQDDFNTSKAYINIFGRLTISPATISVMPNVKIPFFASGGMPDLLNANNANKVNYAFSSDVVGALTGQNDSVISFTAPSTNGSKSIVIVTDGISTATATVTVTDALNVSPSGEVTILAGATQVFSIRGGSGTYAVDKGGLGGTVGQQNISVGSFSYTAERISTGTTGFIVVNDGVNTVSLKITIPAVVVAITNPSLTSAITGSNQAAFTISGSCSDAAQIVAISVKDATNNEVRPNPAVYCPASHNWQTTLDLTALTDGSITITADHSNSFGVTATTATVTIYKDSSVPIITITTPTASAYINAANVGAYTVSGTCNKDGGTINLKVGVSSIISNLTCNVNSWTTSIANFTNITDGAITLTAVLTDNNNNVTQSTVNIIKDVTLPTTPTSISDASWWNSLVTSPTITFTASTDITSGIQKYRAQIILGSNSTSILKTWSDLTNGSQVTGLVLTDGVQYKVQLKAFDNAGNESTIATSDGWTVDITQPAAPSSVTCAASSLNLAAAPVATWTPVTDSSGLNSYQIAVGSTAGGSDIATWYPVSSGSTSYTVTGLALTSSQSYYTSVRAQDNAGNVGPATTAAWTAASSFVKLLMHMDTYPFTDVYNHSVVVSAITPTSTPTPDKPAFNQAAFSPSGSYFEINPSSDLVFGTNDFTIEMFYKAINTANYSAVITNNPDSSKDTDEWWLFDRETGTGNTFRFYVVNASGGLTPLLTTSGVSVSNNVWYHLAITRQANSWTLWVDGTSRATATFSGSLDYSLSTPRMIRLGKSGSNTSLKDELRITIGTAMYTAPFTPPALPFP
jgi:hypothetical protein